MQCKSILIVEDDVDIREGLRELLQSEGYTVFSAVDGKDGLEQLSQVAFPCLVLLDLMMPVMNGWEFLELKNRDIKLAATPVVVMSAVADRAKDSGVAALMKKPLDVPLLLEVVARYCNSP